MTDEELIKRLREGQDLHVLAAVRIEELAMLRRTSALDALAAYGQAQDAHEAQLEAEAKLDKAKWALQIYAGYETRGLIISPLQDDGNLARLVLEEVG